MTPSIWYRNGEWLEGMPSLPANDAGVVYGAVVTDRIRTFRRVPFQAMAHLIRLRTSCETACVPMNHSIDELHEVVSRIIDKNPSVLVGLNDVVVVLLATPGPVDGHGPPTLIAHTLPLDYPKYRPMFQSGAHLLVSQTTRQIPSRIISPRVKHRSRLNWWIARQEATHVDPKADALMLDDNGFITETAAANVIVVKNGELFSPLFSSILPGTSLRTVKSMCLSIGRPFHEKNLRPEDCYAADETLLTNTSWCLAGVSHVDARPIRWPGPVYLELSRMWSDLVGIDYVQQIVNTKT